MNLISVNDYSTLIKEERKKWFKTPYDLVYDNFVKLGLDKVDKNYFFENASLIVENLRKSSWSEFYPKEKEFTSSMLKKLVDEKNITHMKPMEAVIWFVENYPEHIYNLTLSNTQSRRSRAGKEFESIIELILIGAGIPLDSQGNIGKKVFMEKGLGKMVDIVTPGVFEFIKNKRDTILISAKTTLRERWQEVPEEMGRTGAREMFLATLDNSISSEVLDTLYEANIQLTTTKAIKNEFYKNNPRVLTFENLLSECERIAKIWQAYTYSDNENTSIKNSLKKQLDKHDIHDFVLDYYTNRYKDID